MLQVNFLSFCYYHSVCVQIWSYYFLGKHKIFCCLTCGILIKVYCRFVFLKLACIDIIKKTPHLIWINKCLEAVTCQVKIFIAFIFLKLIFLFLVNLISVYFQIINIFVNNRRSFTHSHWILSLKLIYTFNLINLTFCLFWFLFFIIALFYWILKFGRWIITKWWKLFFYLLFLSLFLKMRNFTFVDLGNWRMLRIANL